MENPTLMTEKLFIDTKLAIYTDGGARGNPGPSLLDPARSSLKPIGFNSPRFAGLFRHGETPVSPTPFPALDCK